MREGNKEHSTLIKIPLVCERDRRMGERNVGVAELVREKGNTAIIAIREALDVTVFLL